DRNTLVAALVEARIAGSVPTTTANVLSKVDRLITEHPSERFGLQLASISRLDLLALLRDEAGLGSSQTDELWVDPHRLHDRLAAAGARLARAAELGQSVLLATGHPVGLLHLYLSIASLLERSGASIVTPALGRGWEEKGPLMGHRRPSAVAKRPVRSAGARLAGTSADRQIAY